MAALESAAMALPRFTIVPNIRHCIEEELPNRLRDAGLDGSRVARLATGVSSAISRLEEQGNAMSFPEQERFDKVFRVTSDAEGDVRRLLDSATRQLLLDHPWAIVEGQGRWLAVSRNTAAAFGGPGAGGPLPSAAPAAPLKVCRRRTQQSCLS